MKIEFKNSARNTRGGFAQDTQMFINDQLEQTATCHYINRAWESYAFQSVMKEAVYLRIEEEREILANEWKATNNKKRISKDVKESLTNELIEALKNHRL